jgi:chromatin remodeling complex protein RSC6
MVRTSKSDKLSAATATATTTNVVATPKVEVKETVAVTPVVAAPVALVVEAAVEETSSTTVKLQEFGAKLQQMASLFVSMKSDYKTLEKTIARELKSAQKSSKKRKTSGNRAPSGFVKPTRISDELANFLGKTIGVEMARTEVSKEINAYIREKGLQDKENGRVIHPDAGLSKLLAISAAEELTYFNLQRFMKHHFIKAAPVATA